MKKLIYNKGIPINAPKRFNEHYNDACQQTDNAVDEAAKRIRG